MDGTKWSFEASAVYKRVLEHCRKVNEFQALFYQELVNVDLKALSQRITRIINRKFLNIIDILVYTNFKTINVHDYVVFI